MKLNKKVALALSFLLSHNLVFAMGYPLEFADFFEKKPRKIDVVMSGEASAESILVLANYDELTLISDEENIRNLSSFLEKKNISKYGINKILTELTNKIPANPGCLGELSLCVPKINPDSATFTFDFDNSLLTIYVAPSLLDDMSEEVKYHSGITSQNAIINVSDLYVYASDKTDNISLTNETIIGLPLGYIKVNSQISNDDDSFEINDAYYDAEYKNHRLVAGYTGLSGNIAFNSTDYLFNSASWRGYKMSVGSSSNLVMGNKRGLRRVFFYAPSAAQLEVYRDNKLILQKVVKEGEQSFGYDELPLGVYDISIVLKRGDQKIFEERRFVVNNSQHDLAIGGTDYAFNAGLLELSDGELADDGYANIAASYRLNEKLLFSAGMGYSAGIASILLGSKATLTDDFSIEYATTVFDNGGWFQYGLAKYKNFNLTAKHINAENKGRYSSINNYLYGDESKYEFSISWSGKVFNGQAFLNYTYLNNLEQDNSGERNNLSASWSKDLFAGTITTSANIVESDSSQDFNLSVLWSYDLDQDLSLSVGHTVADNGLDYQSASISKEINSQHLFGSVSAGVKNEASGFNAEISALGHGKNDYTRYNLFSYLTNNDEFSVSGSLSSTQVLSKNNSFITSEQSESYVFIDLDSDDPNADDTEIFYNVLKNNKFSSSDITNGSKNIILPMQNYTDVEVRLDAEHSGYDLSHTKIKGFTTPGTLYALNSHLTKLESQLFVLNDLFGDEIKSATCIGNGCKGIAPISDDGVYRVTYSKPDDFKLISGQRLCVYDPKKMGNKFIQAFCLDGLERFDVDQTSSQSQLAANSKLNGYTFIGKYKATEHSKSILKKLKELELDISYVSIASAIYIYIKHKQEFNAIQIELLYNLEEYAINNVARPDFLYGVN